MSLSKINSLSEKSVNYTNKLLGRFSYINKYKKLHSKKIEFIVFLISILSISTFYFILLINESNTYIKYIYVFTSLSLFLLSIPTLGTIILLFNSEESSNLKIYKYYTRENKITYEESASQLFKSKNNKQSASDNFKDNKNKTGPKEFTPIIFTALKHGLIHYFEKKIREEELAESKENFYKKIKDKEGYNIKSNYSEFWNETGNLETYFKQAKRVNYIEPLLTNSEIKLYPKIIKFLNELKKRINSN